MFDQLFRYITIGAMINGMCFPIMFLIFEIKLHKLFEKYGRDILYNLAMALVFGSISVLLFILNIDFLLITAAADIAFIFEYYFIIKFLIQIYKKNRN